MFYTQIQKRLLANVCGLPYTVFVPRYVLRRAVYSPRSRIELDSNNHTLIAHTYTVHRTVNSNQLGHPGSKTTTVITIIIKKINKSYTAK